MNMNSEGMNSRGSKAGDPEQLRSRHPTELLANLLTLVEEYSPSWYTEEQRSRVLAALRRPAEVLAELCVLLEEYSPPWYSEQLRRRTLAAQRLPTDAFLELCGLIEDYTPSWYTKELRGLAMAALRDLGLLEEEATPEESE